MADMKKVYDDLIIINLYVNYVNNAYIASAFATSARYADVVFGDLEQFKYAD